MKILKHTLIAVVIGALIGVSCSHLFDEYNDDPNNIEMWQGDPMSFLENLVFGGADDLLYRTYQVNGELIQYTVSTSVANAFHRFIVSNGSATNFWNEMATDAANANEMLKLAEAQNRKECQAIALTLRSMYISELTDMFGDIPFSEAFQGYDGNTTPRFDTQEEVYRQLFSDLRRANDLYKESKEMKNASKDLLYGGNLTKWRKFNNSLYLRMLMRVSGRNSYLDVNKQLKEIYTAPAEWPVFESIDDAAVMKFTGVTPNENRFGREDLKSFTTSGRRACQNMTDLMKPSKDPRYTIYFNPRGEDWSGLTSGQAIKEDESEQNTADYLNIHVLGQFTSWFSFMNYDEVLFIWAEAAQRGLIAGGETLAAEMYSKAIEQSVRYWNAQVEKPVSDLVISDFLAKVSYDGTYEQLMNQKYIALFWVGYQGWAEYRRTGYPRLTINPGTENNHIVPRRFTYPVTTRDTNLKNYNEALRRLQEQFQGDDDMLTPVWWSQEGIRRNR